MTKNVQVRARVVEQACLLGIAMLALAGFSWSQAASDWPQFLNDNMSRSNPNETILNRDNVGNLQLLWRYHTGVPVKSSPVLAKGLLYIGSGHLNLLALNPRTGVKVWAYQADSSVNAPPAVANGVVSVASDAGTLYGIDAVSGGALWSLRWWGSPLPAAVANNQLYQISNTFGNIVEDVNPSSGAIQWAHNFHSYINNVPSAANGKVYSTSNSATVDALDASTGALLWTSSSIIYIEATAPAIANGRVYVVSGYTLYAFDPSTGALLWSQSVGGGAVLAQALAVDDSAVYISSLDNGLHALDANTGAELWSYATGDQLFSSPAVANGVVYVGSRDHRIYALDAATGAQLWSYATAGQVNSSPTVAGGMLYVGSDDGYVYAFGLPGAGLNLHLVASPTPPAPGALMTYTFKVWNQSTVNAVHEVLTTQVPAGTTFSSIALSGTAGLGSCTTPAVGASGPVVCHENSVMRAGSTWTIRLTVQITAPVGTVLSETAIASSDNLASVTATIHNTVR